jgi:hypothetical protein
VRNLVLGEKAKARHWLLHLIKDELDGACHQVCFVCWHLALTNPNNLYLNTSFSDRFNIKLVIKRQSKT